MTRYGAAGWCGIDRAAGPVGSGGGASAASGTGFGAEHSSMWAKKTCLRHGAPVVRHKHFEHVHFDRLLVGGPAKNRPSKRSPVSDLQVRPSGLRFAQSTKQAISSLRPSGQALRAAFCLVHQTSDFQSPALRSGGIVRPKDPVVLLKEPGVLLKGPGILLKGSGVISKDPGAF